MKLKVCLIFWITVLAQEVYCQSLSFIDKVVTQDVKDIVNMDLGSDSNKVPINMLKQSIPIERRLDYSMIQNLVKQGFISTKDVEYIKNQIEVNRSTSWVGIVEVNEKLRLVNSSNVFFIFKRKYMTYKSKPVFSIDGKYSIILEISTGGRHSYGSDLILYEKINEKWKYKKSLFSMLTSR